MNCKFHRPLLLPLEKFCCWWNIRHFFYSESNIVRRWITAVQCTYMYKYIYNFYTHIYIQCLGLVYNLYVQLCPRIDATKKHSFLGLWSMYLCGYWLYILVKCLAIPMFLSKTVIIFYMAFSFIYIYIYAIGI